MSINVLPNTLAFSIVRNFLNVSVHEAYAALSDKDFQHVV